MIKYDVTIRKSDIMAAGALEHMINDARVTLGDVTYGTGTLRFLCFSGTRDATSGLYCGAFCFELVTDTTAVRPECVADFDKLFALQEEVDDNEF